MSASAMSARQGRDASMRLGADPPVSFHVQACGTLDTSARRRGPAGETAGRCLLA